MSSQTDVFNLALSFLGAPQVISPTEANKNARALLSVYDIVRQGELRIAPAWNFSIEMAQLAASSMTPLFDRAYSYQLPSDFITMAEPFPESNYSDRDWEIQNGMVYTNYTAPLNIRYVQNVTDISRMDPLFIKAFAAMLAHTVADTITQSNAKVTSTKAKYDLFVNQARQANAFEIVARQFPRDTYLTVRI